MDQATKQKLIDAGREDLVKVHEINLSGYAGALPSNGMIVDRREYPEAIPAEKNPLFNLPEPKRLTACQVWKACKKRGLSKEKTKELMIKNGILIKRKTDE